MEKLVPQPQEATAFAEIDQRNVVDQHCCAISLDGDVALIGTFNEIELVGEAGTAATFDGNAQCAFARLAGNDSGDPLCCGFGYFDVGVHRGVRVHGVTLHLISLDRYVRRAIKSTTGRWP
jgi:hypothetical protein